ncbi:glycine cleavage system H protein [Cryptococcus gattii Ru294]|uniref:Glycine cleavage system H protein n=5 Tax=Cryptococcus gattii species complex TaxID=1884637 RepID=E6RFU5_CRYGW|nr:Glycine dehydrogenase (decarboxylating), putative [Cryptococcus gattii WM276]KAE8542070.1 glycine cleavage system H protein [Cryptococcus gattii VGV]KIR44448.1 glycine cleavage system H protein [Cryptococcus bacillisporus CA1280]KIR52959.1 glycine cleavage system H protein [Cryptococcus gattii Ru294]KIR58398.1 glycine cleavage system H protein [Cryptococcus bacillisporus CA1873]KIR78191.1 glycine cleavage system H protein [Cryptococcus gattii EJB2]KIR84395.1 glycine cleavage system H prote|eukprot:KIR58398.1 glycine cleavage system H protein [Cryptococcus gattii CA1873]
MLSALRPIARPLAGSLRTHIAPKPAAFRFSALRFASTTKYSTDHEWVTFDSDTNVAVVGITDYAQKALGDVVFVELPSEGTEVAQGDSVGAVESVKAASDIYAPVSGVVESINETLADQPSLLNKSPEKDGWLCKVKLSDPAEFDDLLSPDAYKAHCEGA